MNPTLEAFQEALTLLHALRLGATGALRVADHVVVPVMATAEAAEHEPEDANDAVVPLDGSVWAADGGLDGAELNELFPAWEVSGLPGWDKAVGFAVFDLGLRPLRLGVRGSRSGRLRYSGARMLRMALERETGSPRVHLVDALRLGAEWALGVERLASEASWRLVPGPLDRERRVVLRAPRGQVADLGITNGRIFWALVRMAGTDDARRPSERPQPDRPQPGPKWWDGPQ